MTPSDRSEFIQTALRTVDDEYLRIPRPDRETIDNYRSNLKVALARALDALAPSPGAEWHWPDDLAAIACGQCHGNGRIEMLEHCPKCKGFGSVMAFANVVNEAAYNDIIRREESCTIKSSPAAEAESEGGLGGKTPWEFACAWYNPKEIESSIFRQKQRADTGTAVPEDIYSEEFVDWMTEQYRLAMAKGIDIGLRTVTPAAKGVDLSRVVEWQYTHPRTASELAFTAGPERDVASLIELERRRASQPSTPAAKGSEERVSKFSVPEDFYTHQEAWRATIQRAIDTETNKDDRLYYKHELKAFDDAYSQLPPPSPPAAPEVERPATRMLAHTRGCAFVELGGICNCGWAKRNDPVYDRETAERGEG